METYPDPRVADIERRIRGIASELDAIGSEKAHRGYSSSAKAAAILGGVGKPDAPSGWFKALYDWKIGQDPAAAESIKGWLGSSEATGAAVAPNYFTAGVQDYAGRANPWSRLITYRTVNAGFGVDIP